MASPFDEWLWNARIEIPLLPGPNKGMLVMNLTDVVCTDFSIGELSSTPTSAGADARNIAVKVSGLQLACDATLDYHLPLQKHPKSTRIGIRFGKTTGISFDAKVQRDPRTGLPSAAAVAQVVTKFDIVQLNMSSSEHIDSKILTGIISDIANDVIKSSAAKKINVQLAAAMAKLTDVLKPLLQPVKPASPPVLPEGSVDLKAYDAVLFVNEILSKILLPNIATGVDVVFKDGNLSMPLNLSTITQIGSHLRTVGVSYVTISGLDSWSNGMAEFLPTSDDTLDNAIGLGALNVSVTWFMTMEDQTKKLPVLRESGTFYADLRNMSVVAQLALGLKSSVVEPLSLTQLIQPGCISPALEFADVTELALQGSVLLLREDTYAPHGSVEAGISALGNNFVSAIFAAFTPSAARAIMAGASNGLLRGQLNAAIVNATASGKNLQCVADSDPRKGHALDVSIAAYVCGSLGVAMVIILGLALRERNEKWRLHELKESLAHDASLAHEINLPVGIRFGIIPLLLLCTGLFLIQHTNAIAFAVLEVRMGSSLMLDTVVQKQMFVNILKEFWNSKAYVLVFLVAVGSFVFPYARLTAAFFAWVVHPHTFCVDKREKLLATLDATGKIAFSQVFLSAFLGTALRYHLPLENSDIVIDVKLLCSLALTIMVIAVLLSLIITHIMLAAHRVSTYGTEMYLHEASVDPCALWSKMFTVRGRLFRFNAVQRYGIFALLALSFALVVYGASSKCVSFKYQGVAGYMLGVMNQPQTKHFNIFELTSPDDHPPPPSQVVLKMVLLGGVLMPLLDFVLLAMLWVLPMKLGTARKFHFMIDFVGGWASLDVLVLILLAVKLEIRQFVSFIFVDKCPTSMTDLLHTYLDKPLQGDDVCFDVIPNLESGTWYLLAALVTSTLARAVIDRASHQVTFDPELRLGQKATMAQRAVYHQGEHHRGKGDCPVRAGGLNDDDPVDRALGERLLQP